MKTVKSTPYFIALISFLLQYFDFCAIIHHYCHQPIYLWITSLHRWRSRITGIRILPATDSHLVPCCPFQVYYAEAVLLRSRM